MTHSYEPSEEVALGVRKLDVGHGARFTRVANLGHDTYAFGSECLAELPMADCGPKGIRR